MKKSLKIIALILSFVILFSSCFRKEPGTEDASSETKIGGETKRPAQQVDRVRLPFSLEDSLNPFFLKGVRNISLVPLMFDSLYVIDEKYMPVPSVALEAVEEGLNIKVILKEGITFSDSSLLTSADVVYSFHQARLSPSYKSQLSAFSSCEAAGRYEVRFALKQPTLSPLSLLDFPIVKQNTADQSEQVPKGSGRYIYRAENGEYLLEPNPSYRENNDIARTIRLIPIGESVSPVFILETGELDACFDDLSSGAVRRADAAQTGAVLNNLVYLGVNSKNYVLSDKAVRNALSRTILRSDISTRVYSGNALPAQAPVNPAKQSYSYFADNIKEGIEVWEELGYNQFTSGGVRRGGRGVLSFTLICPSENQFKVQLAKSVAGSLKEAGIKITVRELTTQQYKEALNAGNYDLYIGETRLLNNMDLSEFFKADGALSFGIDPESPIAKAYFDYVGGTISESVFCRQFVEESPFIPLVFRMGVLYYSRGIDKEVKPVGASLNVYANIHEWNAD